MVIYYKDSKSNKVMKTLLKTTSIKIPQELLDSLQELANKDQRVNSRNDLIKNILFDYVEANNEK